MLDAHQEQKTIDTPANGSFEEDMHSEQKTRLTNRSIYYLAIAMIAQILFWYFAIPGPQIKEGFETDLDDAILRCLYSGAFLILLPMSCCLIVGENPLKFGLGLGDYRYGLFACGILIPVFVVATALAASDTEMQAFYPIPGSEIGHSWEAFWTWVGAYLVFYIAFEFFYRGFLLFAFDDLDWTTCMAIQTLCCVMIHVGKPLPETIASVPAAIVFGWLAFRTRSILYPLLIHIAVGVANDIFILSHRGEWLV